MTRPGDADDIKAPQPVRAAATEKPDGAGKKKLTREERLAKALRDNLRRRKAADRKD